MNLITTKMKNYGFLLSVMMIITSTIISCSKNDDNPQSVTKKPFAWASGNRDSTGYGMILFSADSGSTWIRQGQGNIALKDIDVLDIWAVNPMKIYVVGKTGAATPRGFIGFTLDGGATWRNDSVPAAGGGGGADINHLIMLNSKTWWGAFDMGHVYLTTDGGSAWTMQQTGQGGSYLLGIDAWDSRIAC
jgi:hypothetical protein